VNGLPLYKANNDREQGWLDLKEWLKPYKDEQGINTANLVIFDTCTNLIRTLPQLMRDKNNPNDVDSKTNHELTHAPDAIRYYVTGRPTAYKAPKARKLDNNAAFASYIFTSRPARYADEGEITVL
jgi:phage terminase large subunit